MRKCLCFVQHSLLNLLCLPAGLAGVMQRQCPAPCSQVAALQARMLLWPAQRSTASPPAHQVGACSDHKCPAVALAGGYALCFQRHGFSCKALCLIASSH
jgi:hypothetical protein